MRTLDGILLGEVEKDSCEGWKGYLYEKVAGDISGRRLNRIHEKVGGNIVEKRLRGDIAWK